MPFKRAFLSTFVIVSLSACGGNPAPVPPAVEQADEMPAAVPATAEPPVPAVLSAYAMTPATEVHANCSLDAINGSAASSARVEFGTSATFEGWIVKPDMTPAGSIRLVIKGEEEFQVTGATGVSRPDVAAAIGAGAGMAGFKIELAPLDLPKGVYTLTIESSDNAFRCNTTASLTVS